MKNVVIVGFGFMGVMHAQSYAQIPNAKVVGVVDKDPARAQENLTKIGLSAAIYKTLGAALSKQAVDVVDICVPTDLHKKYAMAAIKAGKHLFCEKPVATKVSDALKMAEAAEQAGVHSMVGQCIRFWPEYQAFYDFVKSNKAGRLLSLNLQRRAARPTGTEGWFRDADRSLGAAVDLHIHDTDFVAHLLGTPSAVTSVGTKDEFGWSRIFTIYHYGNAAVVAEGGWNQPPKWGFQMAFQAVFENGAVEYDMLANPTLKVTLGDAAPEPLPFAQPSTGASSANVGNVSSLGGYYNELQHFIACLERNEAPKVATLRQAAESLRIVLAEVQSAEKGKTVKLKAS
ncbi:MAG: Gfo/Idh/MocA family oxidoreductase [Verrucomicrobiae bacterium]|nr:Gfo/Idh/MocA family oxidoreductase [Verrucomicrobiae bacterium]